ncbi:glycosyltransferase [Candidatus Roizmanbacteria bacterium]|nr:MAG: glycosyltransferase [Candidatus Roizmanbacteria bacterium]
MIDADLQYPPEELPHMVGLLDDQTDIVVANRKQYKASFLRRFLSKAFISSLPKHSTTSIMMRSPE